MQLLEASAEPLREHSGDEKWQFRFPLERALSNGLIAALFLMLWYVNGERDKILLKPASKDDEPCSLVYEFEINASWRKKEFLPFPSIEQFEVIAAESCRFRSLLIEAERLSKIGSHETSAEKHGEIALIVKHREAIEKSIIYPESRLLSLAEMHVFFKEFYQEQYYRCQKAQFECLKTAEVLHAVSGAFVDPAILEKHAALLSQLIKLGQGLGKEKEKEYYQRRFEEVSKKLPLAAGGVSSMIDGVESVLVRAGAGGAAVEPEDIRWSLRDDESQALLAEAKTKGLSASRMTLFSKKFSGLRHRAVERTGVNVVLKQ